MKPITGFKAEAPAAGYEMLPKGLYVAGIQNVRIEGEAPDQRIVIRLDIIEGPYTGYYTKRYNSESQGNSRYEVKYKGDYRLQIPDQGNPKRQHCDWDYKTFSGAIWAIEDSNDGYHWDWNEQGLKGKVVGINIRQGEFNGTPYTTIGRLESVKMMQAGKCKVMNDMKPRQSADSAPASSAPAFTVVEEEIPF